MFYKVLENYNIYIYLPSALSPENVRATTIHIYSLYVMSHEYNIFN